MMHEYGICLPFSCLAESKQSVSREAEDSEKFTSEVLHQVDTSVTSVTGNTANQQSSIRQLNTVLSNSVSTSMEVCVCVHAHVCVCVNNTALCGYVTLQR